MRKFGIWRRTISGKLTMIYAAMFIVVLLVLNGAALLGLRYFVFNNAKNNLDTTLDFVLNRINSSGDIYDTELLNEISQSAQNIYFRILSPSKGLVVESNLLRGVDLPIKKGYNEITIDERSFIYRNSLIIRRGLILGYLQVVRETTLEYRFLRILLAVLLTTSLVGSIGAIFSGYTVTRRTLKPIKVMTDTARKISGSDLGRRLEVKGPDDELNNLARTFNSMLERLENAFRNQQQFVSDASHELKTPISVIQGYVNLLDRWGKEEKEVREEAIKAIKEEVKNMNDLVEGLLFLARGDSDRLEVKKEPFRVDKLLDEVIKETEMIADGFDIKSKIQTDVKITADRKLIKQMLRIFIDNSLKYTPRGGKIEIGVRNIGKQVEFVVADTGIGIPKDEIPRIFDRFYRVDKSRSAQKGGTGLGLSIAKWIIDNHQGEVEVNSETGEGTEIRVRFPFIIEKDI